MGQRTENSGVLPMTSGLGARIYIDRETPDVHVGAEAGLTLLEDFSILRTFQR